MTLTAAVLALLAAVVVGSMIARALEALLPIPAPFVQIALGGLLGVASDLPVAIGPDLFLLVFIAPLLFLDGWRTPREGLLEDKWVICALAFGLVLFTVIAAGLFIHWLVPEMPQAVAFALAAVLSPTDAVAVTAISRRAPLPRRLLHIVQGEALLNDASGLVCMRFAIAAALSGNFSLARAALDFLWLAAGGLAIGAAVAFAMNAAKDWIAARYREETGSQILISLLIPFAAYLAATQLSASGILAAVAAGVAMNHEERSGRASSVTRIRRAAVWDAVQFAGNGVVFVLLGHQLPAILAGAEQVVREAGPARGWWLLGCVLAINAVLLALRGLWAGITLLLLPAPHASPDPAAGALRWRLIGAATFAGPRGAVSLAGVMTLPLVLEDGSAFPARDLAILLAAGVIVASLISANLGLPHMAKGWRWLRDTPGHRHQEDAARLAAARSAIRALQAALETIAPTHRDATLRRQAAESTIAQYRTRIAARGQPGSDAATARRLEDIERDMRTIALRSERDEYFRIARSGKLPEALTRSLVQEIDLEESRLSARDRVGSAESELQTRRMDR